MPTANVDLADAPAGRLRPLLDAFAIELHYNLHTNRIKIQATVSADSVPHLARTVNAANIPTATPPVQRERTCTITSTNSAIGRH